MKQPDAYKADLNKRNYDYLISFMRDKKLHSLSESLNLIIDLHRHKELIETLRGLSQ